MIRQCARITLEQMHVASRRVGRRRPPAAAADCRDHDRSAHRSCGRRSARLRRRRGSGASHRDADNACVSRRNGAVDFATTSKPARVLVEPMHDARARKRAERRTQICSRPFTSVCRHCRRRDARRRRPACRPRAVLRLRTRRRNGTLAARPNALQRRCARSSISASPPNTRCFAGTTRAIQRQAAISHPDRTSCVRENSGSSTAADLVDALAREVRVDPDRSADVRLSRLVVLRMRIEQTLRKVRVNYARFYRSARMR